LRIEHGALLRSSLAAIIVFVFVASMRFLSLTGFPDDHYVHLAGAQQMLHGEWPSKDFVDLGAPLTYAIPAVVQAIFGQRQLTEALLMAVAFGLGAVLTLRAGVALTGSIALGLIAALIEFVVYPRTYSYPKIVIYAAASVALLWYARHPSLWRIVGLAGLASLAALVRHDHGLYLGIASVAAVALTPLPSDRSKGVRSVATLAAACVVFMLPYLIYLQIVDGIIPHLQRAMTFAALEVPRQRLTLTGHPFYGEWLLAVAGLTPVAALVVLAIPVIRRRDDAWAAMQRVAPVVVLALVANAGLIRDRLDVRLPDAIVPPALLLAWLAGRAWHAQPRPIGLAARIAAVAVLLVTMWCAGVMGSIVEQFDRTGVFAGLDRVPAQARTLVRDMERPWAGRQVPSAVAGEMRPFFDYAERCTQPDQRLLVAAFLPEVAVLAKRPFAGGQVWFMAGAMTSAADHALAMSRIERQHPPIAVFRRPNYDDLVREFPELDAYIMSRYTEVSRWSLGGDDVVYLMMDKAQAKDTDAKTGWPCYR
jgi:hypothetical protein